ncbi:MAG TPA: carbon-nitrogen hydrolase family protein, partial [Candidatus Marinimicrobia bacterium]|nr:carbon-nitrogen hydrolase family protein [Candidatus Neomarinimicrobiota bacterium]
NGLFEAELRVSSFQNGYFCALSNRVGIEDKMEFSGESFVTNPAGEVIAQSPAGEDHILMTDIDLNQVSSSHARKLFFRDRRPEVYPLHLKKE